MVFKKKRVLNINALSKIDIYSYTVNERECIHPLCPALSHC